MIPRKHCECLLHARQGLTVGKAHPNLDSVLERDSTQSRMLWDTKSRYYGNITAMRQYLHQYIIDIVSFLHNTVHLLSAQDSHNCLHVCRTKCL